MFYMATVSVGTCIHAVIEFRASVLQFVVGQEAAHVSTHIKDVCVLIKK